MMENNQARPNLFTYATSELSQDAFICWLAAWADPKFEKADPNLHQTGQAFLLSMIHKVKPDYSLANIQTVKVRRQVEKLDILIEVNEESPNNKLAILIEDKTHTDHHSGQLERYYDNTIKNYTADQIVPIYLKTGYLSRVNNLKEYKTYLRKEFLTVLEKGQANGVTNHIYIDFLRHLDKLDKAIHQFSTKNLADWQADDWRGFFMNLYDARGLLYEVSQSDEANWNYIANPSGGFFGFWWYFKRNLSGKYYESYLQLEENCLCYKIMVDDGIDRRHAREDAYQLIRQSAVELGKTVARPDRMGNGRYMTVAKWPEDYRKSKDGKLDFEATLENLKKAQQILDTAFPQ